MAKKIKALVLTIKAVAKERKLTAKELAALVVEAEIPAPVLAKVKKPPVLERPIVKAAKAAIKPAKVKEAIEKPAPAPTLIPKVLVVPEAEEPVALPAIRAESDLPGVARFPKPRKVYAAAIAPTGGLGLKELATLELVSYHFLMLMERLATEQGGASSQALEDLKADIAKRKI